MKRLTPVTFVLLLAVTPAGAVSVFDQPHDGSGIVQKSSWYPPDGLDGDAYCWDSFTLATNTAVVALRWRGAYELHPAGIGQSPVSDFMVAIHRSIPGDSQPDLAAGGRLVQYSTGGAASESPAGTYGGVVMYDYTFTLPSPFQAAAGTTYWIEMVASQGAVPPSYAPDWGFARGTGGNNLHFRKITGGTYQTIANDLAFSLSGSDAPTVSITAVPSPVDAGGVTGAGAYPFGSLVSLTATPTTGHGFLRWTEGGATVASNSTFTFTATVDRSLVAVFDTAFVVTTARWPAYAGSTTGDGVYTNGSLATVTATADPGFVFTQWSDGTPTSGYTFPVLSDLWLTALFASAPWWSTFDFDGASAGMGLPLDQTVDGLTAHFTGGYSIQSAGALGFTPQGFSGLCLYPNSVFPSDLTITFSQHLTDFSILYAPNELGCDASARMRVTASLDGVFAGTNTMVAPVPGTWPTANLRIHVPTGFNSAVVHWDAPGTRCTDYGPIFMADILTVRRDSALVSVPGGRPDAGASLSEPRPNPFREAATLCCTLPAAGQAKLCVHDLSGRIVRTLVAGWLPAGPHEARWDGTDDAGRAAPAGMYVVRLQSAGTSRMQRVVLVR